MINAQHCNPATAGHLSWAHHKQALEGSSSRQAGGDRLKAIAMTKPFERHRQAWTAEEIQKLHAFAKKGMALKAIAKALTRSEESVRDRAKADQLSIAKLR